MRKLNREPICKLSVATSPTRSTKTNMADSRRMIEFFVLVVLFPVGLLFFTYDQITTILLQWTSKKTAQNMPLPGCPANYYSLNDTCEKCPFGEFSMPGWIGCMTWLNCDNISHDVRVRKRIGKPGHLNAVKEVYLADWSGYDVVYSTCAHEMFSEDCMHGMNMVQGLQGSSFVVQLIGVCYDNLEMVTAYHPYGSAEDLDQLLNKPELKKYNSIQTRFQLSLDYVSILDFLHNSPLGTRVMCDTNDIDKTLSQYLISKDFRLVLNDVDALPQVIHQQGQLIKCGRRQITGTFVAPEQLWPFKDKQFSDDEMPSYDEKIDIYRIPSVVDRLLSRVSKSNDVRRLLLHLHEQCRLPDPKLRPSAAEVLKEYYKVLEIININIKDEI